MLMAREMELLAGQSDRVRRPVYHRSISIHPGDSVRKIPADHLTRDQWRYVADRVRKALGLEGYQTVIVRHGDTRHEHVHLMVNRVAPFGGSTWSRWQEGRNAYEAYQKLERDLGLYQATPAAETRSFSEWIADLQGFAEPRIRGAETAQEMREVFHFLQLQPKLSGQEIVLGSRWGQLELTELLSGKSAHRAEEALRADITRRRSAASEVEHVRPTPPRALAREDEYEEEEEFLPTPRRLFEWMETQDPDWLRGAYDTMSQEEQREVVETLRIVIEEDRLHELDHMTVETYGEILREIYERGTSQERDFLRAELFRLELPGELQGMADRSAPVRGAKAVAGASQFIYEKANAVERMRLRWAMRDVREERLSLTPAATLQRSYALALSVQQKGQASSPEWRSRAQQLHEQVTSYRGRSQGQSRGLDM